MLLLLVFATADSSSRGDCDQGDETWLRWFQQFERLLQPLQRISDDLEASIEAMR